MSRIRTIKPEFWKHEDLSALPPETHMLAAALLNYADDEGYFNANPKLIQAECCPLREDSTNVRRSIDDLSKIGYLELFEASDGKQYGRIVTFGEHQRVDRGKPSKIKALINSTNNRRTIDDGSTLEQGTGNREGKGTGKSNPDGLLVGVKPPTCPHQQIIELYHEVLPMCPRVQQWTDQRQAMLKTRWCESVERQSLNWWREFFTYVAQSNFLTGHSAPRGDVPPFVADLEWLVRPKNFVKVLEGRYENRKSA